MKKMIGQIDEIRRYARRVNWRYQHSRARLARAIKKPAVAGKGKNDPYDEIRDIEKCFNTFLELFSSLICSRCYGQAIHHPGLINNFLRSARPLSEDKLDKYFDDIEHGLFHGLMTCFIIFLLDNDGKNFTTFSDEHPPKGWSGNKQHLSAPSIENYFASGLLHDFLKTNDLVPDAAHDRKLSHYFPHLAEEAFSHSDPRQQDTSKVLIAADRIELQRYRDYENWVDRRLSETLELFSRRSQKTIAYLYSTMRPTLEYFYKNRNELFIRHGLKNIAMKQWKKDHLYPPPSSFYSGLIRQDIEADYGYSKEEIYPIESDRLPFCQNLKETRQRQNAYCSHHDTLTRLGEIAPWGQVKGFISLKDFRQHKSEIVFSEQVDHLHAASEIPVQHWYFLYQHIEHPPALPKLIDDRNRKNVQGSDHPFVDRRSEIVEISQNQLNVISQETLFRFHNLVKLLTDRMCVMN